MKTTRFHAAVLAALVGIGLAGTAAAQEGTVIKSRLFYDNQHWTGGGPPDGAFTYGKVVRSRTFGAPVAGDPVVASEANAVRSPSYDDITAWVGRDGGAPVVSAGRPAPSVKSANTK